MGDQNRYKKRGLTDAQNGYHVARKRMLEDHLVGRGIRDSRVLDAMAKVPRHLFVEEGLRDQAYGDYPLNIGEGQTISQPLMVALMTETLQLKGTEKILEIGTGSGYQTAVLCELVKHVYSIERILKLANRARKTLYDIGYVNFTLRIGDGTLGWPEEAPFDGIIVTAGAPAMPKVYLQQLTDGGRLIIPVGNESEQILFRYTRQGDQFLEERITGCRFVKLIGSNGWRV